MQWKKISLVLKDIRIKGRLIKYINESSLIGKTLHCGCKEMGSTPISR